MSVPRGLTFVSNLADVLFLQPADVALQPSTPERGAVHAPVVLGLLRGPEPLVVGNHSVVVVLPLKQGIPGCIES